MSEWFQWQGENCYAVRGEDAYLCGQLVKRDGEDKWEAWAAGDPQGVFVRKAAARQRVEQVAAGKPPRALSSGALFNITPVKRRGRPAPRRAGQEPRRGW